MKNSINGIVSIVFGILGIICIAIPFVLILFGILALYFGIKSKKDEKSFGAIGIILGTLSILLIIFMLIFFFIFGFFPFYVNESCSMYHSSDFNSWWNSQKSWYENKSIEEFQFKNFPLVNGINKGDLVFILPTKDINIGDIILFTPPKKEEVRSSWFIHRVTSMNPISTKGDHNKNQINFENSVVGFDETNIPAENILGKTLFKIPYLGKVKLMKDFYGSGCN